MNTEIEKLRTRLHESEQDKRSGDEVINTLRAALARVTAERDEAAKASSNWKWNHDFVCKQRDGLTSALNRSTDDQATLRAALARVTAESGRWEAAHAICSATANTLRAHVAAHEAREASLHKELSLRLEHSEQRNAELVDMLRELHTYPADRAVWEAAGKVLTRAESATPASEPTYHVPQSQLLPSYRGETPAKHCEDCAPEFGCFDGGEPCYKKPLVKSTP